MTKFFNFLLTWKNIKQLNLKYFEKLEYNSLIFQIKKNQTSYSNLNWLNKHFKKLLPWKKKTYRQRWFEEQIFFIERKKKTFPFWVRKQFWLQHWYLINHSHSIYLLKEIKLRFFFFDIFNIYFYTMFTKFFLRQIFFHFNSWNNIFFNKISFKYFLNLFDTINYNYIQSNFFFIFSRNKFYWWDKYKIIDWKNFKWNILISKKIFKNFLIPSNLIFLNIKNYYQKTNKYLNKQELINYLINFKKSNSCLKNSINLPKYVAHLNNFLHKIHQSISFSSIEYIKYLDKISHRISNFKFIFLKKNLLSKYIKHSTLIKFIHLNNKWFKLYYNNRKILKKFLFLKNKKQYFTTKFLSSFLKKSFFNIYENVELNLLNALLRSRFALSYQHAKDLLFLGYVYINGKQCKNDFYLLKSSDCVQLILDDVYLVNYQYQYLNLKKKQKNIKYCFQRWYNHRFDFYKQHTKRFPNWLLKLLFLRLDVPLYIEIDYTTLTFIILRPPFWFYELNTYLYKYINIYFIRLYNWKYLT